MLASLRIQNLALVENLEWNLSPGFVAITGETGSGKSIIIGALNLLLGERADKTLIRTDAESCSVEAVFQVDNPRHLNAQLEALGVEPCAGSELIVKRVFTRAGMNRQFVNCCATTLGVLKTLGDSLVDLHGPHEHQSLLSSEKQLAILDAFASADSARDEYADHFSKWHALIAEHDSLCASESTLERELDLLKHQMNEIESAGLRADEEEPLLARYALASNSRRLTELSAQITQRLAEADDAALVRLAETQRLFRELEKIDPETTAIAESHANAIVQIEDAARSIQQYSERLEIDPAELAQIEERISSFETLKRKYGKTIAEVIAFGEEAAARLHKIASRGEEIARLAREIAEEKKRVESCGAKLSAKRKGAAPKLATGIKSHLRDLGFNKSGFEIALVDSSDSQPAAHGFEGASFLFSANPGEPLKPLKTIASSGEISRVMLAVKTALAAQDKIPLLVFDEIDANVGGEIAHAVGAKMKSLGDEHQVLCISHLPQVAALAASQFVVTKEYHGGRTISQITEVKGKSRVEEIARMLGGKTDSALAHAKTLLGKS